MSSSVDLVWKNLWEFLKNGMRSNLKDMLGALRKQYSHIPEEDHREMARQQERILESVFLSMEADLEHHDVRQRMLAYPEHSFPFFADLLRHHFLEAAQREMEELLRSPHARADWKAMVENVNRQVAQYVSAVTGDSIAIQEAIEKKNFPPL